MFRKDRRSVWPRLWLAAIIFLLALPAFAGQVNSAAISKSGSYGRFIVRFAKNAPERSNSALRQKLLDTIGHRNGVGITRSRRLAVGADVLETSRRLDGTAAKKLLQQLASHPGVEYAGIDSLLKPATFYPNDPSFNSQWGLSNTAPGIRLPIAWDTATGAGVVVAVLDTGIAPHSDLSTNVIAGYDFVSDPAVAGDGNARDSNPNDDGDWCEGVESSSWHGTHVAGTIAAVTNNAKGVAGVAYAAKIEPLRVLGRCGGYLSDVSDAIVWAAGGSVSGVPDNANPAEVINMSLVGDGACDDVMQAAIDSAVDAGSVVVAAAGNNQNYASQYTPASCENVITVTAVGHDATRASYANFGDKVDLAAPGGDGQYGILSTANDGTTTPGAENYLSYQGTSMAAAHASGVVALMQSVKTNTPAAVEAILKNSARPFPAGCTFGCGNGLLDAAAAVANVNKAVMSIKKVRIAEGDSGSKIATFEITLSKPLTADLSYDIQTVDGTATAGSDYVASSLTGQTIPAGQTSATFSVTINGDSEVEADEDFFVSIPATYNAEVVLENRQAKGTIVNDDVPALHNGEITWVPNSDPDAQLLYIMDVPAGAADLDIVLQGGYGTSNLYVKFGSPPSTTDADCIAAVDYQTHECFISSPSAGRYYVMVAKPGPNSQLIGRFTPDTLFVDYNNTSIVEGNSGSKLMTFTVKLARPLPIPVSYDIAAVVNWTADESDFVPRSLTGEIIPAGQTSKTFSVTVNGDTDEEPNEFFSVMLSNSVGVPIDPSFGTGAGTIVNDDGKTLSVNDVAVTEGNSGSKTAVFTVKLSQPSATPVTYNIMASPTYNSVTADSPGDFVQTELDDQTIPAGQTSKTFSVPINGDANVEANETFRVWFMSASGASIMNEAVGTIINDDGPTLSIGDVSVVEGNSGTKTAAFTVRLSEAAAVPVRFDIATANGTATAGSDYVASSLSGQLIPAGNLSKSFNVTLNGDTTIEPDETFTANLSNASGATIADAQAIGTISNDDKPSLSISDASISEGNSGTKLLSFTVHLSAAASTSVTYNIATANGTATAGSDYVASSLSGQLIPAGSVSKSFNVTLNGDAVIEPNETILVNISSVVGATVADAQATGTISNDDVPSLSINDASISEGNSGTKQLSFTVHLSQAASTGVTYNIATSNGTATAGSDYVASSLNAQLIPAGNLSKAFNVTLNGDTAIEANETLLVKLSGATGATIADSQATGTISNDDVPSLSISDAAISEGNSGTKVLTFTVHLSAAAATGVTYNIATSNGTATAGSDYVASSLSGQLIPAGNLSKNFSVTLNGDTTIEPNETITVTLSNPSGATISDAQATGTISNDDVPSLSISDAAINEGNSGTKTLVFTVHLSQAASTGVTYNIATANGTATAGSDYIVNSLNAQLIPAGSVSRLFSVTLNGDTTVEPNETFTANLSAASGATISDAQAIGTISNDD